MPKNVIATPGEGASLKLLAWNVNGIRAVIKKGFEDFVSQYDPDILCLQETKAHQEQVDLQLPGYHQFWCSATKKGYSGTAVFTKIKPLASTCGLGIEEHDQEGRMLTLEFPHAYLVNVYTPNSQDALRRLTYRTELWDQEFRLYVSKLAERKPVIFCGDLNVAHKEIDIANPKTNQKSAGFTPQERASFELLLGCGFVDTFRHFNSQPHHYSWWSYRMRARERNVGWRIDYFCVSTALQTALTAAYILPQVEGSDHCPVGIEIKREALVN